jgi:hypothetical protein
MAIPGKLKWLKRSLNELIYTKDSLNYIIVEDL